MKDVIVTGLIVLIALLATILVIYVISFLLALFYSIYSYFKDGYWENVFPISWDIFVGIMSAISESGGGSGRFGGGSGGRGGFGGGSSRGGGAGRSF